MLGIYVAVVLSHYLSHELKLIKCTLRSTNYSNRHIEFMQFFHSIIQFNKDLLTKYYMPGYVEDIASPIKSKIDLVPVLMKVMSLTLNIGKKKTTL